MDGTPRPLPQLVLALQGLAEQFTDFIADLIDQERLGRESLMPEEISILIQTRREAQEALDLVATARNHASVFAETYDGFGREISSMPWELIPIPSPFPSPPDEN